MKGLAKFVGLAIAALAAGSAQAQSRKVPESLVTAARGAPQRVIVMMAPNKKEAARKPEAYIASTLGTSATGVDRLGEAPLVVAEVNRDALGRLAKDPNVARVFPDTPLHTTLPDSTRMLRVPDAWSQAGEKGDGVSVAVLDTGVASQHPFLAGRIVAEACFSSTSDATGSKSLCPNGQNEQIGPGAGEACDYKAVSVNCVHGTHVAGIIAGANGQSDRGTLNGVAPGAKIVAVQVFSRIEGEDKCGKGVASCTTAYTSDIIKGLLFVEKIRDEAKVAAVNMSLGGGKSTTACDTEVPFTEVFDRMTKEGVALVVSAGNDAFPDAVSAPACVKSAITVGAMSKDGAVDVSYSNTSPQIDLLAPGTKILSSAANGYYELSGTSMAAPHVAGLFALLKAKKPDATVEQMLEALQTSGTTVIDPRSKAKEAMPNAAAAVAALGGGGAGPTPGPGKDAEPKPDPRVAGCGPVCVEDGGQARRVIFVLASHERVSPETLKALSAAFGAKAKIEDMGDGKLAVELPAGTSADDVDRARRDAGGGTRVFPDQPLETLQPGGRIEIK